MWPSFSLKVVRRVGFFLSIAVFAFVTSSAKEALAVPPAAPTNLGAEPAGLVVELDWDNNTEPDFDEYAVYRGTTSGGPYTELDRTTSAGYTDTTAAQQVTYFYVVTAFNTGGEESAFSNEVNATLGDTTPPAAPTNLVATAGDMHVSLDWDDNTEIDLDRYFIYRATVSGGPYTLLDFDDPSEYVDGDAFNGTTYYYVVTARDVVGNESGFSNEASGTPGDVTPPAIPSNLSASPGNTTVFLDWDDNTEPDLATYTIYRSTTSGGPYTEVDNDDPSEYVDGGLTNGVTYYYVVTATDISLNESGFSNEASVTPFEPGVDELILGFRIGHQDPVSTDIREIAVDSQDSILLIGTVDGVADFNSDGDFNDTGESFDYGGDDVFISKFDANGSPLWAQRLGGASILDRGLSVGTDDQNNVYFSGLAPGVFGDFDLNGDRDFNDPFETVHRSVFISSFDANGVFRWGKRIGGLTTANGNAVAFGGPTGNLVFAGSVRDGADLNGDNDELDGAAESGVGFDNSDMFVSVFDTAGTFRWAKRLGSADQFTGEPVNAAAVDSTGQVILVGSVSSTVDSDLNGDGDTTDGGAETSGGPGVATSDAVITVFDSNGNHQWAKRLASSSGFGFSLIEDVALDGQDNIYVAGFGALSIDLNGDGDFADPFEASSGTTDMFISVFDSAGTHLWAKRIDGLTASAIGRSVATDLVNGLVTIGGDVTGQVDLNADGDVFDGPFETGVATGGDNEDMVFSTFALDGTFVGANRIGNAGASGDFLSAIRYDSVGNFLVAGVVLGDIDFNDDGDFLDPGEDGSIYGGTAFDGFVIKRQDASGDPPAGPNQAPVVDAGPDLIVTLAQASGTGFFLDGSVLDDGLPNPPSTVDILWTHHIGPGLVNFQDATSPRTQAQLSDLGTHTLRLNADDGALVGFDDAIVRVVNDLNPPAPPTNLVALPGDEVVVLDWDDNTEPDLQEYVIYFSTTMGGPYEEFDSDDPSIFPIFGLTNDVTYYFVVTAKDSDGFESGFSNEASATPMSGLGCTSSVECDDGLFCNGVETCFATVCVPGTPVNCDDSDFCTVDTCNEVTDTCDNDPLLPPAPVNPSPTNGATDVPIDTTLTWNNGSEGGGGGGPLEAVPDLVGPRIDPESADTDPAAADTLQGHLNNDHLDHDCGFRRNDEILSEFQAAIDRGEIDDPALQAIPQVSQFQPVAARAAAGPLNTGDLFIYEDTDQVLVNFFTDGELFAFMVQAANELMTVHGDNYDYIGFWLNFEPFRKIGSAFYLPMENDVSGIGDDIFDNRPLFGLAGNNTDGLVMMYNVADWDSGTGSLGRLTQLVLAHEFEHRFGVFLDPVQGGTVDLQGDGAGCGRPAHWSWKVDAQGSAMELREWIGSSPAVLGGDCPSSTFFFVCFNADTGGSWSYPDLYLMGYASASEMDAGNSQFRYMDASNCSSNYSGNITQLSSADIIAANGPRVPDSTTAQKDFRAGWIMVHQPGAAPTATELNRALGIMEQQQDDWVVDSLSRGTLDNSLVDPCPTTFDVFLDTTNPPTTLVCDDVSASACDPGPLQEGTTYFWQVVANNASGSTAGPVWSFTTEGGGGLDPALWMSFRSNTSVPGVGTVADDDIVAFDTVAGTWSLIFDGSDVGIGGLEIDGLAVLATGEILMSFTVAGSVPGLTGGPSGTSVDDSDIVLFTPTSLGADTAGSFSFHFDGSDVGLTSNGEDIDSIALADDGRIIISTTGSVGANGISGGRDEDLFVFNDTSLGASTSGSFQQFFDGSDVGLANSGSEDVDAAGLTSAGNILFSTVGNFSVSGAAGADEDVAEFTPTSLGTSTAGSFTIFLDLSTLGINTSEDIGSLFLIE